MTEFSAVFLSLFYKKGCQNLVVLRTLFCLILGLLMGRKMALFIDLFFAQKDGFLVDTFHANLNSIFLSFSGLILKFIDLF